jgi:hypothetical protein
VSLYLAVFDGDDELAGLIAGSYSDFGIFREAARRTATEKNTDLTTLLDHSDCDGEWGVQELPALCNELSALIAAGGAACDIRTSEGLLLVEELLQLARFAREQRLPIKFQ